MASMCLCMVWAERIHVVVVTGKQLMLATGDSGGTVHIMEVPWSLAHSSNMEVRRPLHQPIHREWQKFAWWSAILLSNLQLKVMELFFEREVQRIEFVNKRNQVREAQKKALDQLKIENNRIEGSWPAQDGKQHCMQCWIYGYIC